MKIILSALSTKLLDAWTVFFASEDSVEITPASITTIKCDAVVSPANSFGFMDGGLDYALSERFGWELQNRLQEKIREMPEGELLVGQAIAMETGDKDIPFLISAPTMRIPTSQHIDTSVNAYLAMKAILITAKNEQGINSIAIPGLCTGTGRMEPLTAARQMYQAYREIILGERMDFSTFTQAQDYHWAMNPKNSKFTYD